MLPPQEKTPMTGTLLRGKAGWDGGDRTDGMPPRAEMQESREALSVQGFAPTFTPRMPRGLGARETSGFFVMFTTKPHSLQPEDKEPPPSFLPQTENTQTWRS